LRRKEEKPRLFRALKQENPPMKITPLVFSAVLASTAIALQAATLEPIKQSCTLSAGERAGTLRLETKNGDCRDRAHCGTSMSDLPLNRFRGISLADFADSGAHLTATLAAEAGTFVCEGSVTDGELNCNSVFTPDAAFVARMAKMGFTGLDSEKLLPYTYFDIQSGWAQSLKDLGIQGLDSDKLIALRIFNVNAEYVHSLTALGFALPDADQLVSLRVQGVNAEEVAQIRALGYQPTLDQLVQIRIFKVTPDFIRSMQARGFKNLTIDKLVQILIFKLAD
jgi:hypothetical protein